MIKSHRAYVYWAPGGLTGNLHTELRVHLYDVVTTQHTNKYLPYIDVNNNLVIRRTGNVNYRRRQHCHGKYSMLPTFLSLDHAGGECVHQRFSLHLSWHFSPQWFGGLI